MRIWTVHPRYLDRQGLVALWREGLLAQAVLLGKTKGYRHHPQLVRFQAQRSPPAAMATYLAFVQAEATRRGYHFDADKIPHQRASTLIAETQGQLLYEWSHLLAKLETRSPDHYAAICHLKEPACHPSFEIVPGDRQPWEKGP
jgi:hypothetical protein